MGYKRYVTHLNGEKTALRKASMGIDIFEGFYLFSVH
jgi:hypothetical protein